MTPDQISKLPPEHVNCNGENCPICMCEFLERELANFRRNRDHRIVELEATIATLARERDELITGLEPNGYPLWFNRAVHECPGCDPEDLCNGHYAIADRGWTGCEKEIEAFRTALSHTPEGGK